MKKENSNTTKYRAPAIERAFHILELLATSSIPLTSTRIAKLLEKTPGEVFRMLEVLIKLGYVTKDSTTATFTLSLKIFLLSQEVSLTNELIKAAGKPMLDLQKETDQASYLVLLNKGDGTMVTVHQQAALSTFYINQPPGKTTPVSIGSSGISILSRLPEELIDEILRNDDVYFRGTQKYKKEVWQKIRERKQDERVYIDYEFGLCRLIALVKISKQEFATLTMSVLESQTSSEKLALFKTALEAAAEQIEENIKPTFMRAPSV